MQAIAALTSEHRTVERLLSALEGLVEESAVSGVDGRGGLGKLVGVLRRFIDELHHPKEVGILLALLLETGLPAARGPTAAVLADHAAARRALDRLQVLACRPEPWNARGLELLSRTAADLAVLLRGHMAQEEALLFVLADRAPEGMASRGEAMFVDHEAQHAALASDLAHEVDALVARWAPRGAWPEQVPAGRAERGASRPDLASPQSLLLG
ncbi:MAG: hemerythrin domain-containing protein [Myxococcales bacterium]